MARCGHRIGEEGWEDTVVLLRRPCSRPLGPIPLGRSQNPPCRACIPPALLPLHPGAAAGLPEAQLQACMATCLLLHDVPHASVVASAVRQLQALPAWPALRQMAAALQQQQPQQQQGPAASWALLPLLSMLLPGLPGETLLLLAASLPAGAA